MSCEKCAPFGGLWIRTEKGMRRCDCVSGAALAVGDKDRAEGKLSPPVLSSEDVTIFVEMLAGNHEYFPGESGARIAIGDTIRRMCQSKAESAWLVRRMGVLYRRWPGVQELRRVYCVKHRPLDGIELIGGSETYPDGIPSENPALNAPEVKYLPAGPGEPVSAAESVNATVLALAQAKDLRNVRRRVEVPDIPILPPGQRVTQADIDSAVNRNRDRIAREELHGPDKDGDDD